MQQLTPEQIEAWRSAIRQETFANYHYEMGVALERNGYSTEAAASYRRAIECMPRNALAHARLIEVLEQAGLAQQAAAVRDEAARRCPDYAERWMEEQAVTRAQQALRAEDLDEAAMIMRGLSDLSARGALFLAELSRAFRHKGRSEEAAFCVDAALNAAPALLEAQREQAFLAWPKQQIELVEKLLQPVLAAMPNDQEVATHLAFCHLVRLDFEAALALTTPFCRNQTSDIFLAIAHGSALQITGRYEEALSFFFSIPQVQDVGHGDRWGVLCRIGLVLQASGRDQEAVACYEEALATAGTPAATCVARNHLGLGLLGVGNLSEALQQHEAVVAAGVEQNAWMLSNHALSLLAVGREEEADGLLLRSLSCPDAPQIPFRNHLRPRFHDLLEQRYARLKR
ncbi:hypothetical protein ABNQ39_35765 (plasmid) [Azospirillum sp. A26]|uniref:hypothetical protein n=1 Tax=Azospirillum sp. A26 TaxID=3160607 RepID=UPI003670A112